MQDYSNLDDQITRSNVILELKQFTLKFKMLEISLTIVKYSSPEEIVRSLSLLVALVFIPHLALTQNHLLLSLYK